METTNKVKRIGGSLIAAIRGTSEYKTQLDAYNILTGNNIFEGNEHTKSGEMLEPIILDQFAQKMQFKIGSKQKFFEHPTQQYCICYVDAIANDHSIVSVKNTSSEVDIYMPKNDWVEQLNWEMGLSGVNRGFIAFLSKGYIFDYIRVDFDQEMFDSQLEHAKYFWETFILEGIAPEPTTIGDIDNYITAEDTVAELNNDELYKKLGVLKNLQVEEKEIGQKIDCIKEEIKLFMKENSVLEKDGKVLVTWKQGKDKTIFDKKGLENTYPDLYEEFVSTTKGNRTMLIKK